MAISDETLDQLIGESKTTDDLFGKGGLIRNLSKRLVERMLECEMEHHLGYAKHEVSGNNSGNSRNGYGQKKVILSEEKTDIVVPRDRNSTFEQELIAKRQSRISGINDMVLSLYGKGMTVRDIILDSAV